MKLTTGNIAETLDSKFMYDVFLEIQEYTLWTALFKVCEKRNITLSHDIVKVLIRSLDEETNLDDYAAFHKSLKKKGLIETESVD